VLQRGCRTGVPARTAQPSSHNKTSVPRPFHSLIVKWAGKHNTAQPSSHNKTSVPRPFHSHIVKWAGKHNTAQPSSHNKTSVPRPFHRLIVKWAGKHWLRSTLIFPDSAKLSYVMPHALALAVEIGGWRPLDFSMTVLPQPRVPHPFDASCRKGGKARSNPAVRFLIPVCVRASHPSRKSAGRMGHPK